MAVASPSRFVPPRLERAGDFLRRVVAEDRAPAVGAVVGTSRWMSEPWLLGRQRIDADGPPLCRDALFLIASPTKPIVALALMMLVEEGRVQLADPIAAFVPEFGTLGKRSITLAHVLTHTSGLPDMLGENAQLRQAQAPLAEFVRRTCLVRPAFPPGHDVQYQSMGYLMLGEVVRVASGMPLGEFLQQRVFEPLSMRDTSLGRQHELDRVAQLRWTAAQMSGAEHWNSPYWLGLGAPWGGLISTPVDLARLCQHLLAIHRGERGILSRATLGAMTTNQLAQMPDVPEKHRRCYPWGYGWQLNWPGHATSFGDLLSPAAYGHWGATGTMVWIDPLRETFAVALSTQPLETGRRWLTRFSNIICAAIE
jgi:CubicO group peptidase (beta-lactamase class C family)